MQDLDFLGKAKANIEVEPAHLEKEEDILIVDFLYVEIVSLLYDGIPYIYDKETKRIERYKVTRTSTLFNGEVINVIFSKGKEFFLCLYQ